MHKVVVKVSHANRVKKLVGSCEIGHNMQSKLTTSAKLIIVNTDPRCVKYAM